LSPYNEPLIKEPTGDAELDSIHQELGLQAPARYEIYNRQTGNSVEDAPARVTNDAEAITHITDYFEHGPHGLQPSQAARMFSIRSVRRQASPTAPRGREYQIFDQNSQQTAAAFLAPSDEAALARLLQYQRSHPDDPYGVRTANGVEVVDIDMPIAQGRAQTSPTGQWKIIDGLGRELFRFRPAFSNNRAVANELAALWARENNFDGNYQVEPAEEEATDASLDRPFVWKVVGSSQSPYQTQGVEVIASSEREAMQKARQQWNLNLGGRTEEEFFSTNEWSATPVRPAEEAQPGSTTDLAQQRATPGTFTGAWRVVVASTGEEVYRFSGIGNNQADANSVAAQWARRSRLDDPIEVYPIMS
jgi:hypothetical protein